MAPRGVCRINRFIATPTAPMQSSTRPDVRFFFKKGKSSKQQSRPYTGSILRKAPFLATMEDRMISLLMATLWQQNIARANMQTAAFTLHVFQDFLLNALAMPRTTNNAVRRAPSGEGYTTTGERVELETTAGKA